MKNIIIISGVIIIVLIAVFMIGNKQSDNISVNQSDEQTRDANKTIEEQEFVNNFPNVPIYPGAKLEKTSTNKTPYGQFYEGVWKVQGQVPEVIKWYVRELEQTGWLVKLPSADLNQVGEQSTTYAKDNMEFTVNAGQETDTELGIAIAIKVFDQQ